MPKKRAVMDKLTENLSVKKKKKKKPARQKSKNKKPY